jgi:membrane glycosyltransferase
LVNHHETKRLLVREDRHPNSVTAPPLNRGSMAPRPWRGFWNSMATAVLLPMVTLFKAGNPATTLRPLPAARPEPWQSAAKRRRAVFLLLTLVSTVLATSIFADMQPDYDNAWLQYGQITLFALLSAWVVTGFMTAMMGFYVTIFGDKHALSSNKVQHYPLDASTRTAIIMPICNEDVRTVFAGLRATCESVAMTGHVKSFDVFVLSDSNNPAIIQAERAAWEDLRTQLAGHPEQPQIEVYYRLRKRRTDRKAGNVADFCRRWGKDYRYMVVLDADSVMSGDCLVSMVKLMEANPKAGIIQTATQAIGHVTLHARAQQFASRVTGRLFTLGMQFWQMGESHYWGHNAIIRIAPFMEHCALAHIKGTGGMAGSIMSHDFVEAALMRRAGYHVWLVGDLVGSYEQQPPDLLAELQRDRRWCQGNLQNSRLIAEPGIHPVHRSMFGTGAMAYLSAPLWLCFLTLGTALWLSGSPMIADWTLLPGELMSLWAWTLCMLFLPRILGIAAVLINRQFMPPMRFIIFIMPPPFIFFIMPCICSNSLSRRLTSCTCTPAPAAMRRLRVALMSSGLRRSSGVMLWMMPSLRLMSRSALSMSTWPALALICAGSLSIRLDRPPMFFICCSWPGSRSGRSRRRS